MELCSFDLKENHLTADWMETHSSPAMGERPQQILNKQILATCDVLVGVFWTRLGTKTPEYGGVDLQTNDKNLVGETGRRGVAIWEAALEELVSAGLLVGRGHKDEIFEVTKKGYEVADYLTI